MNLRFLHVFFLLFVFVSTGKSQSYSLGFLPQLNLCHSFSDKWKLGSRMETRQIASEGKLNCPSIWKHRHDLVDIALMPTYKTSSESSLGLGYLIRFRDAEIIHRLTEQFVICHKLPLFDLSQRFVLDHTFRPQSPITHRFRYRLSLQLPLIRAKEDFFQLYLKLNNEYLSALEDKEIDLEIRAIALLGVKTSENSKVEGGLDYRVNSFITNADRHQFWFYMGWFWSI